MKVTDRLLPFLLASWVCATANTGFAETLSKSGTFAGLRVNYKVVLPPAYDANRAYPAVLAFGGGLQTMDIVDGALERNWRAEAERRGYIVVIPAAPNQLLFYREGDRIFPAFLEQFLREYKVAPGQLHIAGSSNGGSSALHIASQYPQYFRSVIAFPGILFDEGDAPLNALAPLCIFLYVGELDDPAWVDRMRSQSMKFSENGLNVRFSIERNQPHGIRSLAGAGARRLFDHFEEAVNGCRQS